jgi:hypothetical protein
MAGNTNSTSLEDLLRDGWDYHDAESEGLAHALEAAADHEVTAADLSRFLRLSIHTIGEHLGDWPRALKLGRRVLEGRMATSETAKAFGQLYIAAVLAGDAITAADLELSCLKGAGEAFGVALLDMRFQLADALIGAKRTGEAARLYRSALDLVGLVAETSQLDRAIAATSNNLAWELYEMPARTDGENALMQLSAETSLEYWLKCGNWINAELAHYLNAVIANVLGDFASGLVHADAALAIIAANGERPFDMAMLQLARVGSLAAMGDHEGATRAFGDADGSASVLAEPDLKTQYAAMRAKIVLDPAR